MNTEQFTSTYQVKDPYYVVLRDWQCCQRPIKRPPRLCNVLLHHQELKILQPNPRHFVHCDKRSLKRVVQSCNTLMIQGQTSHSKQPLLQVCMPQLSQTTSYITPQEQNSPGSGPVNCYQNRSIDNPDICSMHNQEPQSDQPCSSLEEL